MKEVMNSLHCNPMSSILPYINEILQGNIQNKMKKKKGSFGPWRKVVIMSGKQKQLQQEEDEGQGGGGSLMMGFNLLPEACISTILSFTSPKDALRLSLVSTTFKSAAESDTVWENFIPSIYPEIISRSSSSSSSTATTSTSLLGGFSSNKDVFCSLFDKPTNMGVLADEINDSPIVEVRLTVPITDDTTLPVLTFRTWVLGPITCILLASLTELLEYRQGMVSPSASCFTMLLLPIGKLMAATLPTKLITIPGTKWKFSMNPGPFSIKEHVLLSILATTGLDNPFSLSIVTIAKAFYHKNISFWACFLLVQTSQMIGYGFAGIFLKPLVDNPYMWWPYSLLNVSFYRMLHEVEVRPKGQLTKIQFFVIVLVSSFAYYIIPNYFFPSITALSFICWIWKDSVTAQQIGSGLHGLGIGSFSFDWNTITGFLGNPLVMPLFSIVNMMVGFILLTYMIVPVAYWTNSYGAKRFPFFSDDIYDVNGQAYDVSRIVSEDLTLNQQAYDNYSVIYLSIFFIYAIGFQLGAETATLTHFILFHARETWHQFRHAFNGGNQFSDVHNRLMRNYKPIPQWWFYTIIALMIVLALLNSMVFEKQFQLPYWGVLLGYTLPFVLILPLGIIGATTGQTTIDVTGLSELIIGWLYPGNPLANLSFQSYTIATLSTSLGFISEFKFGHYMKIPPKSLFIAQIVGALISYSTNLGVAWWLLSKVKNICDVKKLPVGSPWTCPGEHLLFSKSMIWGGVGPRRMFALHSLYSNIYLFFFIGVIATVLVWVASHMFPKKKWIKLIHVPIILASGTTMPPVAAVHYWSWFIVAVIFNLVIHRKYKGWWPMYNYLLSNGLGLGIAFMDLLTSLTFQMKDIYGLNWWGLQRDDHCPLATCPTAPGIKVDGCPVFH